MKKSSNIGKHKVNRLFAENKQRKLKKQVYFELLNVEKKIQMSFLSSDNYTAPLRTGQILVFSTLNSGAESI